MDLKRTMIIVVLALMPCLLFGMYNVGLQHFRAIGVADAALWSCFWFGFLKVLPIIIVSYVVGLGIEFISAQIRGHEVNEGFLVSRYADPVGDAGRYPVVDGGCRDRLLLSLSARRYSGGPA